MRILPLFLGMLLPGVAGMAAECELEITRKACPGQEAAAFMPYDGKNPTTEKLATKDLTACLQKAERAAKIIRSTTIAQKTVRAKFDGKNTDKSFSDQAACK